MESKLIAAKTALQFGVKVFIGTGEGADKLVRILEGNGDGTYVEKEILPVVNTSRQWISLHPQ